MDAEKAAQAQALYDSVLYAAYGIRDTSLRRNRVYSLIRHEQASLDNLNQNLESTRDPAAKAELGNQIAQSQQTIATLTTSFNDFAPALENQFAYYKSSLQFLAEYDPKVLSNVVNNTAQGFKGPDSYSRTMTNALNITIRDIKLFLNNQAGQVTLETVALKLPE
jgi:hypothetical protein